MSPRPVVVGNLNVDMIMGPLPPWPQHGTECLLPDYELRVGGSAGNAALAFEGLGMQPFLVSNVGSDLFADWLDDGMPMDKAIFREATSTTVSVGITHPNGERTFLTNSGHIGALAPDFVTEALADFVEPGAPVLFCGAFLTTLLADAYEEVFALIRAKGGTVAVDTGWPPSGWNPQSGADLRRWAGMVDHLLLSEAEILGVTEAGSIEAAAAQMLPSLRPGAALVIKLGAAGAAAWRGGVTASWPAPQVEVVDTIGAGDVFNAAYLASVLRGASLAEAVRAGVETASIAISTRPRRYEFPAPPENPALLHGHGPR